MYSELKITILKLHDSAMCRGHFRLLEYKKKKIEISCIRSHFVEIILFIEYKFICVIEKLGLNQLPSILFTCTKNMCKPPSPQSKVCKSSIPSCCKLQECCKLFPVEAVHKLPEPLLRKGSWVGNDHYSPLIEVKTLPESQQCPCHSQRNTLCLLSSHPH